MTKPTETTPANGENSGFVPPYRVGKKQRRTILDSLGHEVGIFKTGYEKQAQDYCNYLNDKSQQLADKAQDWVICVERLPEDAQNVLFWGPHLKIRSGYFYLKDQWDRPNMFCDGSFFAADSGHVTHWKLITPPNINPKTK